MKTSELTGAALDWAVAKCEGHKWRCPWILEKEGYAAWRSYELGWGNWHGSYSTDWAQGGPIIEREKIGTNPIFKAAGYESPTGEWYWQASVPSNDGGWEESFYGPTPLIAAMRCYVASKLGDNIEIPEELK